jgi:hypothetical protein
MEKMVAFGRKYDVCIKIGVLNKRLLFATNIEIYINDTARNFAKIHECA